MGSCPWLDRDLAHDSFRPLTLHYWLWAYGETWRVLHYSKACGQSRVNIARVYLFNSGARLLDRMPPSQAALYQHIRRSLLQAGFIWAQALVLQPVLPPFTDWGWKRSSAGHLMPFWTELEDASKACKVLISCTCKTSCRSCKCVLNGFRCTSLCKCEGACTNNEWFFPIFYHII